MSNMTDSAVGAILEIPPQALQDIDKAERAIKSLASASEKAAEQVSNHWGITAPSGLQKFIDKLAEAKAQMDGLGTINVTLNTQAAVQSTEQLTSATQKTSQDVSKAVQDMASSWNDLAKVNLKGFDITDYGNNLTEILLKLKTLKENLKNEPVGSANSQWMADEIRRIEEWIALYKKAAEEKNKALTNIQQRQQQQSDKAYLDEQKRLLSDILDLRKQVNSQKIVVAQGQVTGSSTLEQDKKILSDLIARLYDAKNKLKEYNAEKFNNVSAEGQAKAQINTLNQENALIKEQMSFRDKLNAAIARGNELTAQTQASKARLGSSDESVAQRQLNTDYKEMLKVIKEKGEIQAKAAEQGRELNQQELTLISALNARYRLFESDIQRVSSAYTKMSEAAARQFANDKSEQLARNAVLLAEAQNKAAKAAQKVAEEEAKATAARNAQRQKQSDKDAARIATAQASAEKEVNDILNKRIELQQRITALGTKQSIAALSDPTAKMNFSDSANLSKYERQMQALEQRLREISVLYPKLARDSETAFNTQKADLLALSLQKVNEEQARMNNSSSSSKSSEVERQLNDLYTERLRLLKEKEQLENKALINNAKGLPDLTARENQLLAEVTAKIQQIEGQINTIGQSYAGLAAKTKHAFALDELRQATDLQNQFNRAIDAIDTSKTKQLVAEYKQLYAENEKLQVGIEQYNQKIANVNTIGDKTSVTNAVNNLYTRQAEVVQKMIALERQGIQEIADFRQQKEMEANQKSISEFVQAEAQKKAEAQKLVNEQIAQAKLAGQQYAQSFAGAMAQFNNMMSGRAGGGLAMNLENIKRVLNDLKTAAGKLNILDPAEQNKAKQLKSAIEELNHVIKQYKQVTDAKSTKSLISPQDAINGAKNATTLKQLQDAYKQLKDVMRNTDPKSQAWGQMNSQLKLTQQQIDEIKKKMGEFQSQAKQTSGVVGQLQGRIAAAFSVGAITGFIKKMVEVRAQFELQRVALGAIIQDRDEANKIFLQVQQMALQSPFSIMQLERATKQIAAFGFEAKKLVPTMKMFADISAGLGVEIDRLVLVMGHLKARNFLEGTMVRQFTNMGFNVLGELSKYYSELEDRMVSVGEVQDRVKKKMISFEDVEEVLKRVTSAGGMFYDMQKKQSDSLWGQMQRITDAYDLMLNEIGQSNEGAIKGALTAIRELIQSWRTLKPYIVAAVAAMGSYMVVVTGYKVLTTTITGLRLSYILLTQGINAAKLAQQGLNITILSNPYAAAGAALAALIVYLWQTSEATSKLNEELGRIGSDMTDSLNESIVTFKQLADTISDANSTYTERTEAITEMRRVYAEILPKEKLEIEYIKSLHGNYTELNKVIQEYYQNKEYQQKMEAVQGSDEAKKVQTQLEETLNQMNEDGAFGQKFSKSLIKSWSDTIAKEINTGKLPATLDSLQARIEEVFNAKDLSKYRSETYGSADLHDVMQEIAKVQIAYGDLALDTANAENAMQSFVESTKKMDMSQLRASMTDLRAQAAELKKVLGMQLGEGEYILDPNFDIPQLNPAQLEEYKERLRLIEEQIKAVDDVQKQWLSNQFKEKIEELNEVLFKDVQAYKDAQNEMRKLEMQGKKNTDEWKKQEKAMNDARISADKTATTYGTTVNWALIDSAQTSFELRDELDKLASKAFPKVAEFAMKSLSKLQEYLLKSKNTVYEWVKGLLEWIPEEMRDALGLNTILTNVNENLALTQTQLDELAKAAQGVGDKGKDAGESFDKLISDKAKSRVKEFGGNITDIDRIISDTSKGADEMAKELRGQAKTWEETANSYRTSTDKALWLNTRNMTEESITLMENNAKAAKALATDLAGIEKSRTKGGKGKDEISELWKNRLKAIQDFYKRYEELRKHFTADESLSRAKDAFKGLFDVLNMDMSKVVSMGMDKQGLANNIKDMLEIVRVVRPKLADEFEKAFADTQIQVDFKIAEDTEEKLKKQFDEMFASYELTEELKKIGVNVDLTYMVGGKPTTLQDIRNEIARLRTEGGGKEDAENRIKILEEQEKKITQMELKAQKERLKNYEKYLKKMYSDRAQNMIEAYTTISQMEEDFQKNIQQLEQEMNAPDTTDARKKELAGLIDSMRSQASEAAIGIQRKLSEALAKADWNSFKGSEIFESMYQDLDTLSKKGIDALIQRLEAVRDKLQSVSDIDPKAVREVTQYIEKLKNAKIDLSPYAGFKEALASAKELKKEYGSIEAAQLKLVELNDAASGYEQEVADLETIISLVERKVAIAGGDAATTARLNDLYGKYKDNLKGALATARQNLDVTKNQAAALGNNVNNAKKLGIAYQAQISKMQKYRESVEQITDAVFDIAEALGGEVDDEWKNLANSIINAVFQGIQLQLQMQILQVQAQLLGVAMNSALGIIGWIAIALQVVANLLMTIFAAHDKSLQKQIERIQDRVDVLSKSFEKLEKSIERAFTIASENRMTEQALDNLEEQKRAYQEMIRLEEAKKKTDDEKIKDYNDKLEELAEAEEELIEKRHEKWGSTNSVWDEANNWVDAWLDAYKETGDGLDVLNDSWDEFYENLVKKQAVSKVLGARMDRWVSQINDAIDKNMGSEYDYIDLFKQIGEKMKAEFQATNEDLKKIFEYAGIGGAGSLILSDLQKGIQNITEPQAAAIEAYLNSMRFAVFRHTEQLDTLIATIQAQYGSGTENPVVTELKGIRSVLDSIDRRLGSVINTQGRNAALRIVPD